MDRNLAKTMLGIELVEVEVVAGGCRFPENHRRAAAAILLKKKASSTDKHELKMIFKKNIR